MKNYRPSREVISADLADEAVLLHMGTKDYFQLNVTGQRVWQLLQDGADGEGVVEGLMASFDVERVDAAAAYERLTAEMAGEGLLEEVP